MMNDIDYEQIGQGMDLDLLKGIALGGKRSTELQLLLDSQRGPGADFQGLALAVADMSVSADEARLTFERLREHQERLATGLGRPVGLKVAALDLLGSLEQALGIQEEGASASYWQLERMAYYDQLTGLHNFRFFGDRLGEEVQRARRYRHQLSLLMVDIDYFKRFNDTHGHQAGNEALRHMAELLRNTVRETDLATRYGGEEFAVILPETTKRLAVELAARLRANVEASPVLVGQAFHRITVSIGVATYPRDTWTQGGLIESADKALYESKHAGRNRVSAYQPPNQVTFKYKPERFGVERVSVVGSFNGWDPLADPMHPQEDGSFFARIALIPGTYEYKYVLNGEQWVNDPGANEAISDGYWGQNSLLHVKG